MADEQQFIDDGLQRTQIDEFFAEELGRAGYGGMDVAKTPMGTQIVLSAEKPGMVIGKGGKNIRKITTELEERFDLDDPQIDVQEVDEPDLNARIVADRLANALERGWYFRKAGHTTIDRIMEAGALGAEIVLSGKVTGARSRVEKFNRGYIKHNGEPAEDIVDEGIGTAVMKLGTIGVQVRIIPPDAQLPDDFEVYDDVEVEDAIADDADETVEDLLEGEPDEESVEDAEESSEAADEAVDEEVLEEEVVDDEVADEGTDDSSEDANEEPVETPSDDDIEEEFDEETIEEIESSVEEMEESEADEETETEDSADTDAEAAADSDDEDADEAEADADDADEAEADEEADEE